MRLATITEYGAATGDYHSLVADLSTERKASQTLLVASFGLADLIEISFSEGDSHLKLPRSSGAHVFRRSFGVLWPEEPDLPCNRISELASADEILQPNPALPLFSITYLKLSPIPTLCIPPSLEKTPLVTELLTELVSRDSGVWQSYREVLHATLDNKEEAEQLGLQIALLIGLDSVDLVLLSRVARLEQIASLAWALRSQQLDDYWDLTNFQEVAERAKLLTGAAGLPLEVLWRQSALFGSSATVLGLPLYTHGEVPTLEGSEENSLIARNVCISTRLTYAPGGFHDTLGLPVIDPETISRHALGENEGEFLLLFDRSDILRLPVGEMGGNLQDLKLRDLRKYLQWLISGAKTQPAEPRAFRSIRARTELAVLTRIPNMALGQTHRGAPDLFDLFHEYLRKARHHHLGSDSSAWSRRWERATDSVGMLYPVTAGVLSLIGTVLDYLEDDIEGFVELLPALEHLIVLAERDSPKRNELISEVLKMSGMLQGLATSRGRRDHPFRFPRETLAFEGHAGNRAPRAAFVAFVESLAEALDPGTLLLVLESSGGTVSCSAGADFNVIRVSPLLFFHPIHWVFAHEVAHGSFRHTTGKGLGGDTRFGGILKGAGNVSGLFKSFKDFFYASPYWLREDFAAAVGEAVEEVPADLMLWDSLHIEGTDARESDRLFWFIHGPGLVLSLRHAWGSQRLTSKHIRPLVLRIFFLSQLRQVDSAPRVDDQAILNDLYLLLKNLYEEPKDTWRARTQRNERAGQQEGISALEILRYLREDLDLEQCEWLMAIKGLWTVVGDLLFENTPESEQAEATQMLGMLKAWLEAVVEVRQHLQERRGAAVADRDFFTTWKCYREYLQGLTIAWSEAYPWLPFSNPAESAAATEAGVAIDPRGGLILKDASERAKYWQTTFRLLLRLDDLGRDGRFRKLAEYLNPL